MMRQTQKRDRHKMQLKRKHDRFSAKTETKIQNEILLPGELNFMLKALLRSRKWTRLPSEAKIKERATDEWREGHRKKKRVSSVQSTHACALVTLHDSVSLTTKALQGNYRSLVGEIQRSQGKVGNFVHIPVLLRGLFYTFRSFVSLSICDRHPCHSLLRLRIRSAIRGDERRRAHEKCWRAHEKGEGTEKAFLPIQPRHCMEQKIYIFREEGI